MGLNRSATGPLRWRPCVTWTSESRFPSERLTFLQREGGSIGMESHLDGLETFLGGGFELVSFLFLTRGKSYTASIFYSHDEDPPKKRSGMFFLLFLHLCELSLSLKNGPGLRWTLWVVSEKLLRVSKGDTAAQRKGAIGPGSVSHSVNKYR